MFNESLNEFNEDFAVLGRIKCLEILEKNNSSAFVGQKERTIRIFWLEKMHLFSKELSVLGGGM
ncbi:MAG: hypothetical protein AB8G86_21570 [Saprospiraceae bacterium]